MLAIKNAVLVMTDHYIPDATLLIENDKIVDFGKKLPIPEGADVIDAEGTFVGPGLIDIHTHADGTTYFHDDPIKCSKTLLGHGVTSVLPALFYDSIMAYEEFAYAIMENPEAFTTIPTDIAADVMIGMLYTSLISALAIAGIVFLVIGITKKWFGIDERLSIRIPKKRTAGVIFKNPGTIIFLVMSGMLMILDLCMPLINQMLEQVTNGGMGV